MSLKIKIKPLPPAAVAGVGFIPRWEVGELGEFEATCCATKSRREAIAKSRVIAKLAMKQGGRFPNLSSGRF